MDILCVVLADGLRKRCCAEQRRAEPLPSALPLLARLGFAFLGLVLLFGTLSLLAPA